ncbi:MAG: DUF3575 domain-containing protein [Saprospiraceae bacterium]|nr:DUF3575 domain-containing protein [Saprospiraceae bacterium]
MKLRTFALSALGLLFMINPSWSQEQEENEAFKHLIKTNPFATSVGLINTTYEMRASEKSSLLFRLDFMLGDFFDLTNGIGGGIGYRYYFTFKKRMVPEGFYIQPLVYGFLSLEEAEDDFYEYEAEDFGLVGFQLGYQWIWNSGFSVDLGIGPGYRFPEDEYSDFSTINPVFSAMIGYAWNSEK